MNFRRHDPGIYEAVHIAAGDAADDIPSVYFLFLFPKKPLALALGLKVMWANQGDGASWLICASNL
jgi:hypothetical protein